MSTQNNKCTDEDDDDCDWFDEMEALQPPNNFTHKDLQKYVGKIWNEECKNEIETEFFPYHTDLYTGDNYYNEIYILNNIRCLVKNNIIIELSFN